MGESADREGDSASKFRSVSLSVLKGLAQDPAVSRTWTLYDVYENLVLQRTGKWLSFVDTLVDGSEVGKAYQGAFVCVPHSVRFCDMVDSLVKYFHGKSFEEQFVWLYLFSVNHSFPEQEEYREFVLHEIKISLGRFEERLIYFNSWTDPRCLRQAWCLLEISSILKSGKPFSLLFQPEEESSFLKALLRDPEMLSESVSDVNHMGVICKSKRDANLLEIAISTISSCEQIEKALNKLLRAEMLSYLNKILHMERNQFFEPNEGFYFSSVLIQAGILLRDVLFESEAALEAFTEALALRTSMEVPDLQSISRIHYEIALVLKERCEYQNALSHLMSAWRIEEDICGGRKKVEVAKTVGNIAAILFEMGNYASALKHFEETLEILEVTLEGRNNLESATVLNNIALVLQSEGDLDGALSLYEEVLEIKVHVLEDTEHPSLANTRHNIASVLHEKGEYETSLRIFKEVLKVQENFLGRRHPATTATLHELAGTMQDIGELAVAEALLNEVLEIELSSGSKHPNTAKVLANIARLHQDRNDLKAAILQYEEVLNIETSCFGGRQHPEIAATLIAIAECLNKLDQSGEALKLLEEADEILRQKPTLEYLARLYCAQGVSFRLQGIILESKAAIEMSLSFRNSRLKQSHRHRRVKEAKDELERTVQLLKNP